MPTPAQLTAAIKACAAYDAVNELRATLVAAGLPPQFLDLVDACHATRLAARKAANEPCLTYLENADCTGLAPTVAEPTRRRVYGEGTTSYQFQRAFGEPVNEQRLVGQRLG